jgi:hypothetical protein
MEGWVMTAASVVLTIVLVAITGYYAWRTGQMVDEMRRARGASLLPKITLSFEHLGGPVVSVVVTNTGAGPALDVDLTMSYELGGPQVRWTSPCVSPGESVRFIPPETTSIVDLGNKYERLVLRSTCKDALGEVRDSHQVLDIKDYWQATVDATCLLPDDYQHKTFDELEKMRRELENVRRQLERIATLMRRPNTQSSAQHQDHC